MTWFLLRRTLFPKGRGVLSYALWISVFGVAMSISLLVLVLAIMSGFLGVLESRYSNITSDVVVIPRRSVNKNPAFRKKLEEIPEISVVSPFLLSQGMALFRGVGGINIEGIDWESSSKVTDWESVISPVNWERQKTIKNWVWIGKQLQEKLGVKQGEILDVLLPDGGGNRTFPFEVTGIMKFGIYDHDLHHTVIDLQEFYRVLGGAEVEPMYKIKLKDRARLPMVTMELRKAFENKASVKQWHDIYHNVFYAVQHQKKLLFIVLQIVVGLAGLNVINLLVMNSQQRKRDLAILRAMGWKLRHILSYFAAQGAVVGMIGTIVGILLGWILCQGVERFQPNLLRESIYNVSRLPLKVVWTDLVGVVVGAFLICVVFSLIPGWRVSRQRPVEVLRNE